MAGFRDAVGRFRGRQAQASEASEAIEADELAAVEELAEIADDPLPQSPASLHTLLRAARERREVLLRSGNVEAVIVVDSEITRLVVGLEAAQARIDADYAEAPARERARLLDVWRRVQQPKLEAAHARRDELAYLLWNAVDAAADAEQESAAVATALGITIEQTPLDSMLSRFLWRNWAEGHARRLGLMPQRAA